MNRISPVVRISAIYATVAALWILLSDRLLLLVTNDLERFQHLQTIKGLVFITLTTLLLYMLLRREMLVHVREQDALQKSEARYRRLAENAPDLIYRYRLGPTRGFEYVSPSALAITGYAPEEFYTDPTLSLTVVHVEDRGVLANGPLPDHPIEMRWVRKDGSVIWVEQRNTPVHDDKGQIIAIEGITRDVTARKQAELAEKEQRTLAEALRDTAAAINSTLDFAQVLDRILANVAQVAPHDAANIMMVKNDHVQIVQARGYERYGIEDWIQTVRFSLSLSEFWGRRFENVQMVVIPDTYAADAQWQHIPETAWIRSFISVPIRHQDQLIGFLNLDSETPNFFSDHDAERLQVFADQAATAIANARLYEDARRHAADLERRVSERTADLSRAKERAEVLLNSSSDIILLTDASGRITGTNTVFGEAFQCDPADFLGRPIRALVAPEHADAITTAFEEAIRYRQVRRLEAAIIYRSVPAFDADIMLSPVVWRDAPVEGVVCSIRDISIFKQQEMHLRRLLQHEIELNELKSRFVSMASHEFRTPLTVIQMTADLLLRYDAQLPANTKHQKLEVIGQMVKQIDDLIEDLLLFSRGKAGIFEVHPAVTDLAAVCREEIDNLQRTTGNQHDMILEINGGCSQVITDARIIRHILNNLLSNAIKYSPAGSTITCTLRSQDTTFSLEVQDEGIGIPAADQPRLFEAFYRAGNVGAAPGTGLGLAIVKQMVDLHNGSITFESEQDDGTTFTVTLPILQLSD